MRANDDDDRPSEAELNEEAKRENWDDSHDRGKGDSYVECLLCGTELDLDSAESTSCENCDADLCTECATWNNDIGTYFCPTGEGCGDGSY